MTPSPPPLGLRSSKEQANARAAAQLNMEDQRSRHALSARRRNSDGSERDLASANNRRKVTGSADQRPATSPASTTNLARAARTHKFRVSAFFSPTCCLQRNSIRGGCTGPWCSISPQSRNKGGVDHQLRSSMEGQTFCDHLQSSLIHHVRCNQVQVPDKNICRHSGTCFPANSGNGTLQGKSSSPKHSCSAACCAVVAKRIEKMATPAGARDRRQKQTKALEKQHTKEICINTCGIVSTVQQPTPLPKLDRFETSRELAPERPEKARLSLDGGGVQPEKLPHVASLAALCQAPSPLHYGLESVHIG